MAGTPERAGAMAQGATSSPRPLWLAAAGALFAVALVAAGASSPRNALLGLGGLTGVVGLGAIVRFAPRRTCDSLMLLFIGLVAIPVDAYLDYHPHTGGWPGIRVSASDVCLYLLVLLAALGALLGRVENGIPRRVLVWMGLLLVQYSVSALLAQERLLSLFEIVGTVHAFLIAWIVTALFRRDQLHWILPLIALQVMLHSGFAIAQGVTGRPIGSGWLGGNTKVLQESLEGGVQLLRPAGLFTHPIVYASFLVITLPLVTAGVATARSLALRAFYGLALGLGAVGLVLTLSRGAWIASLIAIVALGTLALRCRLMSARQIRTIAVVGVVLGLVLGAAFGSRVYERLTRSDAGNVNVRFDLNSIALRMTAANPFFGTGLNNFVETMAPYDPKNVMSYFPAPAHNLYLLEAAEAGVPALLFWLGLFGSILLTGFHHLPRMRDPELAWVVAALVAGLFGFLVSQVADFSHRLEPLRSMVWLDVGLLFGVLQANRATRLAARNRDPA